MRHRTPPLALIPLLAVMPLAVAANATSHQRPQPRAAQEPQAGAGETEEITLPPAEQEAWEAFAGLRLRLDAGPADRSEEAARAFHRESMRRLTRFAAGKHADSHTAAYAAWIAAVLTEGIRDDPVRALALYEQAYAVARGRAPVLPDGLRARGYTPAALERFLHEALMRAGRFDRAEELARSLLAELGTASPDEERAALLRARLDEIRRERLLHPGAMLPAVTGEALGGGTVRLEDYRGRVVLVDLWASWSPPCRASLDEARKTWQRWRGKGFSVLGVSLDRTREEASAFLEAHPAPWTHVLDGDGWDGPLARLLHVRSLPANFLLDRDGRIVGRNLRGDALARAVAAACAPQEEGGPVDEGALEEGHQ